jgi:hypothetical protein
MLRKRTFFSHPGWLVSNRGEAGGAFTRHSFSIHLLALGHTQVDIASQYLKVSSLCSILSAWDLLGQCPIRAANIDLRKRYIIIVKVVGGFAEMRIMTILRRAEPVRFAASTLLVACVWSPTIAAGGVVETSLATNLSNNPTSTFTDVVVGQLSNATTSTTVPAVSNSY